MYKVFLHMYFLATVSGRNLSYTEVRTSSVIQTYPCLLRSDSMHCFMGNTILHYASTLDSFNISSAKVSDKGLVI